MEKVRPWCGQASDRGRLKNRTMPCSSSIKAEGGSPVQSQSEYTTDENIDYYTVVQLCSVHRFSERAVVMILRGRPLCRVEWPP